MDENKTPLNNKDMKVLRTYTSDMADAIRDNEVTVIKIAMAEKEKRDKEEEYKKIKGTNFSKVLMLLGGVILIVGAIFGANYIIQKKKVIPIPPPVTVETFIAYDVGSEIDVTKATNVNELRDIITNNQQLTSKTISSLFLTKKSGDISQTLTSKDFLSLIQTTMPNTLVRSLSTKYLLGEYSNPNEAGVSGKPAMFLIFETTDYNQAYASMLEWEGTMLEDLFVLFDISRPNDTPFVKPWNDIVVSNKDVRVLYGNNGEGLLYYAFVNKNDFVIANNIGAIKEVIDRLIAKNAKSL